MLLCVQGDVRGPTVDAFSAPIAITHHQARCAIADCLALCHPADGALPHPRLHAALQVLQTKGQNELPHDQYEATEANQTVFPQAPVGRFASNR
jgi:hypothetical protein